MIGYESLLGVGADESVFHSAGAALCSFLGPSLWMHPGSDRVKKALLWRCRGRLAGQLIQEIYPAFF